MEEGGGSGFGVIRKRLHVLLGGVEVGIVQLGPEKAERRGAWKKEENQERTYAQKREREVGRVGGKDYIIVALRFVTEMVRPVPDP